MEAILLALNVFLPRIIRGSVLTSDSAIVVGYFKKWGHSLTRHVQVSSEDSGMV